MSNNGVTLHRRVRWFLEQLPDVYRQNLLEALKPLQGLPPDQWPEGKVTELGYPKPRYMMCVPPDLRVFLEHDENDELEVVDVMREEAYQFLLNSRERAEVSE